MKVKRAAEAKRARQNLGIVIENDRGRPSLTQTLHLGSAPYVSKLAKEMKQAIPRSKKWRDVKQSIIRLIT